MSRNTSTYEELVAQYKEELLNDEKFMDEFEERFEERLASRSRKKNEEKLIS